MGSDLHHGRHVIMRAVRRARRRILYGGGGAYVGFGVAGEIVELSWQKYRHHHGK